LPVHVEPNEGEALYSWLARLGYRLALRPIDAALQALGIDRDLPSVRRHSEPSGVELAAACCDRPMQQV